MFLKGHEVFTLPDGRLSTPFHAMQRTIPGVIVAFAEKASEEKSTDEKKDIKKNVCEVKVEGGKIVRTCSE
jgi:hypothetical protein